MRKSVTVNAWTTTIGVTVNAWKSYSIHSSLWTAVLVASPLMRSSRVLPSYMRERRLDQQPLVSSFNLNPGIDSEDLANLF